MNAQSTRFPVTKIQEQLIWLARKSEGGNLAYNIMQSLQLNGRLDRSLMRQVLMDITRRHESLRSSFDTANNLQIIHSDIVLDAKLVDFSNVPEDAQQAEYRNWLDREKSTPFDLDIAPLVRFRFVRYGQERHTLVIMAHHTVCDGWSQGLLAREITQAYSLKYTGSYQELPPAMQFSEYANLITHNPVIQQRRSDNLAFWHNKYASGAPVLNLPTDYSRPKNRTFRSFYLNRSISTDTISNLRKLGGKCGSTLFMVFYSAFALTLHRYTQQSELLIGVPSSGRMEPGTESIVGYIGAVLPLLSQYHPEEDIATFLRRQKSALLDGYQYEDFSFADLVESLPDSHVQSRSALVDVVFNLQPAVKLSNESNLDIAVGFEPASHLAYDIFLDVTDYQGHYAVDVDFNADIFSPESAQRFVDSYLAVLDNCLACIDQPVKRVPLLGDALQQQVLQDWNASHLPGRNVSLSQAIEQAAEQYSQHIALVCDERRLSFADYNSRANQLARLLQEKGVKQASRVGICLSRNEKPYIAFLAVLKLGATFVPLDPAYPKKRLQKIIQLSGAELLLVDHQTDVVLQGLEESDMSFAPVKTAYLNDLDSLDHYAADNLNRAISPALLAYIIYTSGSTGEPKGVAIPNSSVITLLDAVHAQPHIDAQETWLTVNSLSFDICILENFYPMVFGGTLVIGQRDWIFDPQRFHEVAKAQNVSMCVATPSMWKLIFSRQDIPLHRFKIITGGEALSHSQAKELVTFTDHLWNFYGPTEATVWASCHPVASDSLSDSHDTSMLIGKPLENYQFYIVDDNLEPVPPGVPGLLLIGGNGLARGYWNAPAITAARFIPDPFSGTPGARLYNTGDIARYQADGSVEYLSRADDQIKVRGFRIELGEIENAILAFEGVSNAVVIGVKDEQDVTSHKLAAYVEANVAGSGTTESFDRAALLRYLKDSLPAYMLPSSLQLLDKIKLTESRKVDRSALPKPDFNLPLEQDVVCASTPAQFVLSRIWEKVLKLDLSEGEPDIHSSFFDMGGHSLMATQMVDYINRSAYFNNDVALTDIFNYPSIAQLADKLEGSISDKGLAVGNAVSASQQSSLEEQPNRPKNPETEHDTVEIQGDFDYAIAVDPDARFAPFELTDLQQAYWIGRSSAVALGNAEAYNYSAVRLSAKHALQVERAWNTLIARHDMLRVTMTDDGRQQVLPELAHYTVEQEDLSALSTPQQTERLATIKQEMTFAGESFAQADNFSLRLSKLSNKTPGDKHQNDKPYYLHMTLSMMVFDGASLRLIFDELARLLEQPDYQFEPLTLTFRDCVLSQHMIEKSSGYQAAKAYWQDRIATLPGSPKLPLAKDIYAIKRPYLSRNCVILPQAQWDKLKSCASRNSITPSILAFTLLAELLGNWSASRHFTINLTLFNRLGKHPDLHHVVGDFTSNTLMEVKRNKQHSFVEAAKANQAQLLLDIQHRHYGGVNVLRDMNLASVGTSENASGQNVADSQIIMPIVFTSDLSIEYAGDNKPSIVTETFDELCDGVSLTPQVLIDFVVMEQAGDFIVSVDYLAEAFPNGMLEALINEYHRVLVQLSEDESLWHQHNVAGCPPEQLATRAALNLETPYNAQALLHSGFEKQAQATPDAIAIISPKDTLSSETSASGTHFPDSANEKSHQISYQQLNNAASALAEQLIAHGAKQNDLVAVLFNKGWQQTVATLGILKAGAAYLPLNADAPPHMLAGIIEQSGASRLVTESQWSSLPELVATQARAFHLDAAILAAPVPAQAFYTRQTPSSMAYVIYTSGSTGKPKGVVLDHTGPVNTNDTINQMLNVSEQDRVLALSALSFDLSVYDIFGILAAGGAIVYPDAKKERDPEHWHQLISEHNVSIWNTVPALMQIYADYLTNVETGTETGAKTDNPLSSLREVMMSGDWLPVSLPDQLRRLAGIDDPNSEALNIYSLGGATEASIWSIYYPIKAVDPNWKSIPYGKPLPNQTYYVLDEDLNPCPDYVIGDLYIGGIGLAQGYFNDELKTQSSFFVHPDMQVRLYRTGDTGCYHSDGNIEFCGRKDTQVKVQGYRVELGQIEHHINEHPDIKDSVVLVESTDTGRASDAKRLVAYVMRQSQHAQQAVQGKAEQDAVPVAGLSSESATEPQTSQSSQEQTNKALFKLSRKGLRTGLDSQQGIDFKALVKEPGMLVLDYQQPENLCSSPQVIESKHLFELLASLCETTVEQAPLPKYFYPSSGSLNPVQTYVEITQELGTAQFAPIEPGMYYLHTQNWSLHKVANLSANSSGVSSASVNSSGAKSSQGNVPVVRLHLAGISNAITPLYDSHANMLCQVEAGYMFALLQGVAGGLSLSVSGSVSASVSALETGSETEQEDTAGLKAALGLSSGDWLLRSIDVLPVTGSNANTTTNAAQSTITADSTEQTEQAQQAEQDTAFELGIFERQSYRRYDAADQFEQSAESFHKVERLLQSSVLGEVFEDACVTICVYFAQAQQNKHYFSFDVQQGCLLPLSSTETANLAGHTRGNQAVEAQSNFSVFMVAHSSHASSAELLQQCGRIGQRLCSFAPKSGLGLCPVGWCDDSQLKAVLSDVPAQASTTHVVHSFIGGAITLQQTLNWGEVESMLSPSGANTQHNATQQPANATQQAGAASGEDLTQQVKSYLGRTLAPYMVPQIYRLIDTLPLTANGKVDRKRLPSLPFEEFTGKSFVTPSNDLQKQIADVWCSTLNIDKVGIDEHFFAVGGNSVLLIGMAATFKKQLNVQLDIIDLFNYPTVGALAEFVGNKDQAKAEASEAFSKKQEKAAKQRAQASKKRASRAKPTSQRAKKSATTDAVKKGASS